MREIVSIHIGQTAIDLGNVSWELFDMSHYIHSDYQKLFGNQFSDSSMQINSFYKEAVDYQFIPKVLYIDTTQEHLDSIKNNEIGKRLPQSQLMVTQSTLDNCSTNNYFTTSKELMENLRMKIQPLINDCDNLDGFLIYNSVDEGTAGISSRLLEVLKEDYDKKNIFSFNLLPSFTEEEDQGLYSFNIFNSVLSLAKEATQCDLNILFDQRAINNICNNILNYDHHSPYYSHQVIAQVLDSFTYSLRDPTYLEMTYSMNSIIQKLVGTSRMNFAHSSYVNFVQAGQAYSLPYTMPEIGKMLCFPDYSLIHFDSNIHYKINSSILSFNGRSLSSKEVKSCFNEWKIQQWNNLQSNSTLMTLKNHKSHAVIPGGDLEYLPRTACSITNSTLSGELLKNLLCQYDMLLKKKDNIIKSYSKEEYETSDFDNAKETLTKVVERYNDVLFTSND